MPKAINIYCEHSAFTKDIRNLARDTGVVVAHFPYDPDSHTRKIRTVASPSAARICDLNLPIAQLPGTIADYCGSPFLHQILAILGVGNLRDSLHVDSAVKQGCAAFVTCDRHHILKHRPQLETLLPIKFFHPDEHSDLQQFLANVSD